jgi:hypothetical protein
MATSPTHKFGQIIGDLLEMAIEPQLRRFSEEHGLYLDKKGSRCARNGKKVTWTDAFGNMHDLDFVLERGGTESHIGTPVAFIETAWRRYTKHSRNKAQEIQGAIQPLCFAHKNSAPFIGVVLAGDFTEGSLKQLKSLGFQVLYFKYDDIVNSFASVGIDASFDEETPDEDMYPKIRAWEYLPDVKRELLVKKIMESQPINLQQFVDSLNKSVTRTIELVRILPLFGKNYEWHTVDEAISFIQRYDEDATSCHIIKYEVEIRYNTGDTIRCEFAEKETAIQFLNGYSTPFLTPGI